LPQISAKQWDLSEVNKVNWDYHAISRWQI